MEANKLYKNTSQIKKKNLFTYIGNIFKSKENFFLEMQDIVLIGGIYYIIFFIAKDSITAAIKTIFFDLLTFNPPGLTQENILQIINLFLATFPLSIGSFVVTTALLSKHISFRNLGSFARFISITFFLSIWIGSLLGIGRINSDELINIISGHPIYHNCNTFKIPSYSFSSQQNTVKNTYTIKTLCDPVSTREDGLGIISALYFLLIALIPLFITTYGFITCLSAVVLGIYFSWAICFKIASHIPVGKI